MAKMELVSEEYKTEILGQATADLELLNKSRKSKKLSTKDALRREYLRTLLNNPTSLNIVLCLSGRLDEMKRKEEL